ncbi:hypothetical protein MVEN_02182300 [Mycena venus]|uniref:Uncharacterized protein n=1 Tax=Mycena venus TaxID=2733690 RepID=A0A8H6X8D5_9AGAR|nr:hypothetical protein MVEN_02182300 [Mycena venus]
MSRGFPRLLALWGDAPLLPPPPHPYLSIPTWPPWAGPIVNADQEAGAEIAQWKHEGRPLPAHIYTEHSSPYDSPWWPRSVQRLFGEAQVEERSLRLAFVLKYHVLHPDRDSQPLAFLHERNLLLARLTCAHAVFFLRVRLRIGVTTSAAARTGAIVGACAEELAAGTRAAAVYAYSLMQDEYLSAWLDRPYMDVFQWGTVHDLRTLPPPLPPPQPPTWGVGNGWGAGIWGVGTTWGGGWSQCHRRRKRPRHCGFRSMGTIFLQPRPVDWRAQQWKRRRGWLIRLEWEWRQAAALLSRLERVHRELRRRLK